MKASDRAGLGRWAHFSLTFSVQGWVSSLGAGWVNSERASSVAATSPTPENLVIA
jgi:hypothetical protein